MGRMDFVQIITKASAEMRDQFSQRCAEEGRTKSEVLRGLIQAYIDRTASPTPVEFPSRGRPLGSSAHTANKNLPLPDLSHLEAEADDPVSDLARLKQLAESG